MKKALSLVLAFILSLSLCACAGGDQNGEEHHTQNVEEHHTQTVEEHHTQNVEEQYTQNTEEQPSATKKLQAFLDAKGTVDADDFVNYAIRYERYLLEISYDMNDKGSFLITFSDIGSLVSYFLTEEESTQGVMYLDDNVQVTGYINKNTFNSDSDESMLMNTSYKNVTSYSQQSSYNVITVAMVSLSLLHLEMCFENNSSYGLSVKDFGFNSFLSFD